jgi:hypothetical protein
LDVVRDPRAGVLHDNLQVAALSALDLDRGSGRRYAEQFPWQKSAEAFLSKLVPAVGAPSAILSESPARAR